MCGARCVGKMRVERSEAVRRSLWVIWLLEFAWAVPVFTIDPG